MQRRQIRKKIMRTISFVCFKTVVAFCVTVKVVEGFHNWQQRWLSFSFFHCLSDFFCSFPSTCANTLRWWFLRCNAAIIITNYQSLGCFLNNLRWRSIWFINVQVAPHRLNKKSPLFFQSKWHRNGMVICCIVERFRNYCIITKPYFSGQGFVFGW